MKVSIIIPAYNVDNYIFRALESCINQTHENIEIIVIDDGSTDNTYEVAKKYAQLDRRIFVCQQENSGVSSARNYALDLCSSDYVVFLDSDDWIEPNTIEVLLKTLPRDDKKYLVAVDTYFAYFGDNGIWKKKAPNIANSVNIESEEALLYIVRHKYKLRSACYKLFSMEVIRDNNIRFNQTITHGEDGLFVFEYLKCAERFVYSSDVLWNVLERPGSATKSPYNKSWLTSIDAVEKMIEYDNSQKLHVQLKNYRVQRMVLVLCQAIINMDQTREDIDFLRKRLHKECIRYMIQESSIKNKIFYLFVSYFPKKLVAWYCMNKE